jgi:hypothetical protein
MRHNAAILAWTGLALATFSTAARDEVDLNKLTARLLAVVEETMQPQSVTVWLKARPAKGERQT